MLTKEQFCELNFAKNVSFSYMVEVDLIGNQISLNSYIKTQYIIDKSCSRSHGAILQGV